MLSALLPCTTVYEASTEDRFVTTVTSSSLLELSMSMFMERSISRWRLVTMPVGYVMFVSRPSLSYLEDGRQYHNTGGEELQKVPDGDWGYIMPLGGSRTPFKYKEIGFMQKTEHATLFFV